MPGHAGPCGGFCVRKNHERTTDPGPPAQRGLCGLFLQRRLRHLERGGGQPAAGAVRLCLRRHRHPAQPDEHRQPGGRLFVRGAARTAGRDEAQRSAFEPRLSGGLRPDGLYRRGGPAGAGLFPGGRGQGAGHQHLHRPGGGQQPRPHPRHEHHAQLLRLRRAALPLRHCGGGAGGGEGPALSAGPAGRGALAGLCRHPDGLRRQKGGRQDRLELSRQRPLLASPGC